MDHAAFIVAIIERARQERGISVAELARRAQMDRKRLWYILKGERALRADEFVRLNVVMGFGLHHFVTPAMLQTLQEDQSFALRDISVPRAINDADHLRESKHI